MGLIGKAQGAVLGCVSLATALTAFYAKYDDIQDALEGFGIHILPEREELKEKVEEATGFDAKDVKEEEEEEKEDKEAGTEESKEESGSEKESESEESESHDYTKDAGFKEIEANVDAMNGSEGEVVKEAGN